MHVVSAEAPVEWWARFPEDGEPGRPPQQTWVAVLSQEFPAHTVVDLPAGRRPASWQVAVRADVEGDRVHRVEVAAPGTPLLWYVELPEPTASPPATTLLAFSDPRQPEGTVLTADQARASGVSGAQQVAALRWWTGSGLAHQIYVAPAHRQRGIAGKLAQVAYGVQVVRGLTPLHADGRRTDDGEQWRQRLPRHVSGRMAPLSQRLPSMTPGESGTGLLRR
jgi:GNAT superfamily N-acetyltransferase